jgi:hypothetical protein
MNLFDSKTCSFSMDAEINADVLNKLFEKIQLSKPQSFSIISVEKKQIRTHRKKRINKKWAKRYGFYEVTRKLPITYMETIHNDMNVKPVTDKMLQTFKFIVDDNAFNIPYEPYSIINFQE